MLGFSACIAGSVISAPALVLANKRFSTPRVLGDYIYKTRQGTGKGHGDYREARDEAPTKPRQTRGPSNCTITLRWALLSPTTLKCAAVDALLRSLFLRLVNLSFGSISGV